MFCLSADSKMTQAKCEIERHLSHFLLNPEIRTADGEWEAWVFANWFPGARRDA